MSTLLIVDDDDAIREAMADALREEGYPVITASDGSEAIALLPELARPCVMILDMMMPIMAGDEVLRRMRAEPRLADIPVVLFTAAGRRAAVPAGVPVLHKPAPLGEILHVVAGMLTRRGVAVPSPSLPSVTSPPSPRSSSTTSSSATSSSTSGSPPAPLRSARSS